VQLNYFGEVSKSVIHNTAIDSYSIYVCTVYIFQCQDHESLFYSLYRLVGVLNFHC